jgi:hypothetical protein
MIIESKRPEIVDPRTGAIIPVELFVGVLGASRYVLRRSLSVPRSDRVDHHPRAHGGVLRLAWVSPGSEGLARKKSSYVRRRRRRRSTARPSSEVPNSASVPGSGICTACLRS